MRAYSRDLRLRVLNACLEGTCSQREVARRFDVSRTFVSRLVKRYRETGEFVAKDRSGGRRRKIGSKDREALRRLIQDRPDATLSELCERFHTLTGIDVSVSTMHRALKAVREPAADAGRV